MKQNSTDNIFAVGALAGLLLLFGTFLFNGAVFFTPGFFLIFGLTFLCVGLFCWIRRWDEKRTKRIKRVATAVRFWGAISLVLVWSIIASVMLVAAESGSAGEFSWSYSISNTSGEGRVQDNNSSEGTLSLIVGATPSGYQQSSCGDSVNAASTKITVTVTNNSGGTICIDSIDYGGCSMTSGEGDYIENKGSFEISFTAEPGSDDEKNPDEQSGTITVTYSKVKSVDIVFYGADDVSYTYNSATISGAANSIVVSASVGDIIALPSAPEPSSGFIGWRLSHDGSLHEAGTAVEITAPTSVYPVVINDGLVAPFTVEDSSYYYWTDAAYAAANATNKLIILNDDYTLPATMAANGVHPSAGSKFVTGADGNIQYIVPSGVTLLIPYDDDYTLCTTEPTVDGETKFGSAAANTRKDPVAYCKLTMASGANITVNGAISISGMQCFAQKYNGMPTKATGVIAMEANSSITVNNGGFLYAWGYITGSGEISVMSGGTVYEDFQVKDWRGGSAASAMLGEDERVFPVSQYYVQNVEVKMTLYAGAIEKAFMSLVASKIFGSTTVPFIGGDGMFQLKDGYLVKDYLENEDRLLVEVHGDLTMSALNLEVSSYEMNSAKYVLPITNNLYVKVQSGTTTISQDMAFLPGSELVIADGATVQLASNANVFVYDLAEWEKKLFVYSSCDVSRLDYVGATGGEPNDRPTMDDAKIEVNGTLDASLGYLYTTAGGANICSEGYGKVIIGTIGTSTVTYQATQSNTTITFKEIPITPAKLKHANGDYLTTADATAATTYNYNVDHGYWYAGTHGETTSTTPPTCTENGYTNHSCPCGYKKQDAVVDALGHNYGWKQEPVTNDNGTKNVDHYCCTVCQDLLATFDLQYRLNDYTWMNAVITLPQGGTLSPSGDILQADDGATTYYLVRRVLSTELTTDFTATLKINGETLVLDLGFEAFIADLHDGHKHKDLAASMLNYGVAADKYFENQTHTDLTISNAPDSFHDGFSKVEIKTDYGSLNSYKNVTMHTTGAAFSFEERISMMVRFNAADLTEEDISQIGLLVGTGDAELRANGSTGVTAYILYDPNYQKPNEDNPNKPNCPNYTLDWSNLATFEKLDLSQMIVSFDLTTQQYLSRLTVRPYVVTTAGTVIYGEQYVYGLSDYIYRTYNKTGSGYGPDFQNFLYYTWMYATEAQEAFAA